MMGQHRQLQDQDQSPIEREEGNTSFDDDTAHHTRSTSNNDFDPVIFWCVNATWMIILAALVIWLWKFNGAARLTEWTHAMVSSHDSDLAYRSRMATRRNNAVEAKRITPEERRTILEVYYRSNDVQMIVAESDLINEDDNCLAAAAVQEGDDALDIETGGMDSLKKENPSFTSTTATDEDSGSACDGADMVVEDSNSDRDGLMHDEESGSDGSMLQKDALVVETAVVGSLDSSIRSIDQGYLQLQTTTISSPPRRVPNCCAVCLGTYDIGESVVWSTACQHAFHEECVTDWLIKINEGNPCPCCRSVFANVDMDIAATKKKPPVSWQPNHHSMNVNVISL